MWWGVTPSGMNFVIVGAGRVGYRTARVLQTEDHEVTLVDRDPDRAARARTDEFTVIEGEASREDRLVEAGVESADAVGALTGDLNANFAACLIADHHDCRTVMRVDEDYREGIYKQYAEQVDEVIYPEQSGAIGAKNALLGGDIRAIADVAEHLQVVLFTVTNDSPMRGYNLSEVSLPARARILAYGKKDGSMSIPLPDDALESGDRVTVLADFEVLSDVRQLLTGQTVTDIARGDA